MNFLFLTFNKSDRSLNLHLSLCHCSEPAMDMYTCTVVSLKGYIFNNRTLVRDGIEVCQTSNDRNMNEPVKNENILLTSNCHLKTMFLLQ